MRYIYIYIFFLSINLYIAIWFNLTQQCDAKHDIRMFLDTFSTLLSRFIHTELPILGGSYGKDAQKTASATCSCHSAEL